MNIPLIILNPYLYIINYYIFIVKNILFFYKNIYYLNKYNNSKFIKKYFPKYYLVLTSYFHVIICCIFLLKDYVFVL